MLYKTLSAAVYGVDANIIEVEVDVSGIKLDQDHFHTVGLPDAAVRESRDRVRAALKNCGYDIPPTQITINLAPADIRKEGSGFDLPMALAIVGAYGGLTRKEIADCVFVGELSLDGGIRGVRGALPIAIEARGQKISRLVVPELNAREAAMVGGVEPLRLSRSRCRKCLSRACRDCSAPYYFTNQGLASGDAMGRLFMTIISAIAELERSLVIERVRSGMRRARLEGRQIGRARLDVDREQVVMDRRSGMSLTQVAKKHNISRASVCRMVKEVNESSNAAVVAPAGDAGQLFQQAGAGQ
ncbi:MAG TPA: magnesium chelatase domain-containing protein [Terriglobales bacterium]|jgi:hypothetical protein|nr:magnesium chelatase domain-containing protein [Terriglobales bacterium]